MKAYEQFLDGSSSGLSSGYGFSSGSDGEQEQEQERSMSSWLATLRVQQPLLAEHVVTLQGLGQAERLLHQALAGPVGSSSNSDGDSGSGSGSGSGEEKMM